jgi:16S rRNA (guanine527-N7)-methyltransferase
LRIPAPSDRDKAPAPPRSAAEVFGERLPLAVRYAEMLATTGTQRGLIGPRETPRLWDRHILNCAVMESLLPHRSRLIDIGTGAGLPGLVLAIARPDLQVTLVEPLQRRTRWLDAAVEELGLAQVTVLRGRAEEFSGRLQAPVVTARAVARLDQLYHWSWPLLPPGGRLLALKGQSAETELEESAATLERMGAASAQVLTVGEDVIDPPARVIEVVRGDQGAPEGPSRSGAGTRRAGARAARRTARRRGR